MHISRKIRSGYLPELNFTAGVGIADYQEPESDNANPYLYTLGVANCDNHTPSINNKYHKIILFNIKYRYHKKTMGEPAGITQKQIKGQGAEKLQLENLNKH